jgi:uncharacterized repeat protein (TIGR01451 family)
MSMNIRLGRFHTAFVSLVLAGVAGAQAPVQAPSGPLEIRAVAEVEAKTGNGGREAVKLIPADRVVPGDRVLYTLEVRNTGATPLDAPIVIQPVPEHMRYIADTAIGPGAEVTYSVDGGLTFDRAENLKVTGSDGNPRPAAAADYTHIRWQLKNSLKVNSMAFVRFRALVK